MAKRSLLRARKNGPLVPQQTGTDAAGHAHQLHQPSNGRANWPAEICIKRGRVTDAGYNKLTHQDGTATSRMKRLHMTARPRCLVDWALHCSATGHVAQQHPAPQPQLHLHQPLQFTEDLQPASRVSSGTPSLAADQVLFTSQRPCSLPAVNTAEENQWQTPLISTTEPEFIRHPTV
jgi:hypothetical protein